MSKGKVLFAKKGLAPIEKMIRPGQRNASAKRLQTVKVKSFLSSVKDAFKTVDFGKVEGTKFAPLVVDNNF